MSPNEENPSIRCQADTDLATRALPGVRGHMGIALVIVTSTSLYHDSPRFTTAFLILCVLQVAARLTTIFSKKRIYAKAPVLWRRALYSCFLAGAALLGAVSGWTISAYGFQHQNTFFVGCCLVALTTSSVHGLISNSKVACAYLFFSFAPGMVADAMRGGVAGYSLVGGTLLLFFYLVEQVRAMHREYWQGLSDNWNLRIRTRELDALAHHDLLTGLPNRRYLRDRLGGPELGRNSGRVALLFIDLDRFKQINDTFSHRIGDLYLAAVAKRIAGELVPGETLIRVGGDEFILLIENLPEAELATNRAQTVLGSLHTPVLVEGHELPISATVGISLSPEHGHDLETLQKHADIAMHRAKKAGRGQTVQFSPQMAAELARATLVEKELRRALEVGGGLFVHYQPQFTHHGTVIGMEVLVRLRAADIGLVSPAEFIPIAEETGLISSVGYWVLKEACRQAVEWQGAGLPALRIAVNVSAAQLIRSDFVEEVAEVLRDTGFDPCLLELELTESLFMKDLSEVAKRMQQLRSMGIRFSIDDFGAGYSCLSYLQRLPIDALKIDRSFIKDLNAGDENTTVIESILALSRSLKLSVVAEGVETSEQLAILRRLGCNEFQGYFFAKPMPSADIPATLCARREDLLQESCPKLPFTDDLLFLANGLDMAQPVNAS